MTEARVGALSPALRLVPVVGGVLVGLHDVLVCTAVLPVLAELCAALRGHRGPEAGSVEATLALEADVSKAPEPWPLFHTYQAACACFGQCCAVVALGDPAFAEVRGQPSVYDGMRYLF